MAEASGESNEWEPSYWCPIKMAAGVTHTILVSDSGLFYGFGLGRNGELGHQSGFVKFKATELNLAIPEIKNKEKTQVVVGAKHSLILADANVYSTGSGENGRLGHTKPHGKVDFPGNEKIAFIACGTDFSVAVDSSGYNLYAWGLGRNGAGHIQTEQRRPSIFHIIDPFTSLNKRVLQVACGSRHSLALCVDGTVFAWGFGKHGRLGHGGVQDEIEPRIIEKFIVSPEQRVVQICAGDSHSMALNKEGKVFTWGSGSYGRLGHGAELDQYAPTIVKGALHGVSVISVHCNAFHSLAVSKPRKDNISLFTWGGGKYGKLGSGGEKNELVPREVKIQEQIIRAVCGLHHTIAVTRGSNVYAWGYAAAYRCGVSSDKTSVTLPKKIDYFEHKDIYKGFQEREVADASNFFRASQISCGELHNLVLCDDNKVMSWGSNSSGQLGTGHLVLSSRPIPVTVGRPDSIVTAIACGLAHSAAVLQNGSVYTWGSNSWGQLGLGDNVNRQTPVLVKALQGTVISQIHCGHNHTVGIETKLAQEFGETDQAKNKVYVWGCNESGQLGLGPKAKKKQKYPVSLILPSKKGEEQFDQIFVALGGHHTIILGVNNGENQNDHLSSRVFSCGLGDKGQLGLLNNVTGVATTPQLIPTEVWDDVKEFRAGRGEVAKRQYPLVHAVYAGETASFAIARASSSQLDVLYAWGEIPGLLNAPTLLPKYIREFGSQKLKLALKSKNPIFKFSITDLCYGNKHGFIIARYNMDKGKNDTVVFAWGETKYGKLGLGNVPKYLEEVEEDRKIWKKQAMEDDVEDEDDVGGDENSNAKQVLPPSLVKLLSEKEISDMSCFADHSVAVSESMGIVYTFGYGDSGRLGLGVGGDSSDPSSNKSETKPTPIPMSLRGIAAGPKQSGIAEGDSDESEDESDDESENEEEVAGGGGGGGGGTEKKKDEVIMTESEKAQKKQLGVEALEQLNDDYNQLRKEYMVDMQDLERQKDLIHLAIATRCYQSQNRMKSLTQTARIRWEEQEREKDAARLIQQKKLKSKKARGEGGGDSLEHHESEETPLSIRRRKQRKAEKRMVPRKPTGILSSFETLFARFYQRPCMVFDLFLIYKAEIENKRYARTGKKYTHRPTDAQFRAFKMKEEFTNLLFSLYDTHRSEDIRLLKVFLRMMLTAHCIANTTVSTLLLEESFEWHIFKRVFMVGSLRRKIGDILVMPLTELPSFDTPTPVKLLETYAKNRGEELYQHVMRAFAAVKSQADLFFNKLVDSKSKSFYAIMEAISWPFEILYDAMTKSNHKVHPLVGQRVLMVLSEVIIRDREYQLNLKARASEIDLANVGNDSVKGKKKKKRLAPRPTDVTGLLKIPGGKAKTKKQPKAPMTDEDYQEGSLRLVLENLKSEEAFRDYCQARFDIDKHHMDLGDRRGNQGAGANSRANVDVAGEEKTRKLKSFSTFFAGVMKKRYSHDPRFGHVDLQAAVLEREVYADFLKNRSIYKRRVFSIGPGAFRFIKKIIAAEQFLPSLSNASRKNYLEYKPVTISAKARINLRLDPFHLDYGNKVKSCKRCGLHHTYSSELEKKAGDAEQESAEARGGFRFSTTQCLVLRSVLKEPECDQVVRHVTGEGSWKNLIELIMDKRKISIQHDNHDAGHRYERAINFIRTLKTLKGSESSHSHVFIGSDADASIRTEVVDLVILSKKLAELEEQEQSKMRMEDARNRVLGGVVEKLKALDTKAEVEVMKETFDRITSGSSDEDLLEIAPRLTAAQKKARLDAKKKVEPIQVHKEKGKVKRFSYSKLISMDILMPLDFDPSNNSICGFGGFKFATYCCPCTQGADVKRYVKFLAGLTFMFSTTDSPDKFELRLIYIPPGGGYNLILTKMFHLSKLSSETEGSEEAVVPYDPTGDHVPIKTSDKVTFMFDAINLHDELDAFPRPAQTFNQTD